MVHQVAEHCSMGHASQDMQVGHIHALQAVETERAVVEVHSRSHDFGAGDTERPVVQIHKDWEHGQALAVAVVAGNKVVVVVVDDEEAEMRCLLDLVAVEAQLLEVVGVEPEMDMLGRSSSDLGN